MARFSPFCALLALITIVGCAARPKGDVSKSNPHMTGVDAAEAKRMWDLPDTDGAAAKGGASNDRPTAETLARKADEYAKSMEPLIAKRVASNNAQVASASTPPRAPAKIEPNAEPSKVHFNDPPKGAGGNDSGAPAANSSAEKTTAEAVVPATPGPVASVTPVSPSVAPVAPTVTQTPPRSDVPFNKDTPAVNTPLIVGQPRPLPATDELAQRLSQQVKDFPQDPTAQLDWQMLQFLQGQSVPQLQSLSTLSQEDRDILTAVFDGLTNFRNALRADNNMLLSRKIKPLLEAADRLRTQAELSVPVVALCTDVKGFGVYEPIEPARFEAGKDHRVIVYCEVENFASVIDEQKRWATKLTQEVVLYTEQNGLEVWRDKVPARPIVDYSRNRRHDFFIVKMIKLPANLTIGRYLLKVTVVDQQVNRVAENTAPIQIVSQ